MYISFWLLMRIRAARTAAEWKIKRDSRLSLQLVFFFFSILIFMCWWWLRASERQIYKIRMKRCRAEAEDAHYYTSSLSGSSSLSSSTAPSHTYTRSFFFCYIFNMHPLIPSELFDITYSGLLMMPPVYASNNNFPSTEKKKSLYSFLSRTNYKQNFQFGSHKYIIASVTN